MIQRFIDPAIVSRGAIRIVGEKSLIWLDNFELVEELRDDKWVEVEIRRKPKFPKTECIEIKVGDIILGLPVQQIDPEWIEQEKIILQNGKHVD